MNILFRDQSLPNVSPLFNHDPLLFPLRRSSSSPMSAMLPIKTLVTIKLFNLSKSSSFSKFLVFDFISFPFSFSLSFIISLLSLSFLHFPFLLCSLFNPFCSLSPPSFLVTLPALCRLWSLSLWLWLWIGNLPNPISSPSELQPLALASLHPDPASDIQRSKSPHPTEKSHRVPPKPPIQPHPIGPIDWTLERRSHISLSSCLS